MRPAWLDRTAYPFDAHSFTTGQHQMHYVDEGTGSPIVFVHGTPTWSFLWRRMILALRGEHRCVAPDHLGFGLSDKPETVDYTPAAHAQRLEELIEHLGLRDMTLVVHDFGGPIGLSYAVRHPENVKRVVVMNSWLWSNAGNRSVEGASWLLRSPLGRVMYLRLNLSPQVLLKTAFADKGKLTPDVHRHYLAPFPAPATRRAPWILARELSGSNDWYASLWEARGARAEIPTFVLWGTKDPLFPLTHLARWQTALPHARIERLERSGHFVQEEAPEEVSAAIRSFLAS